MRICLVTHGLPPHEITGVENYTLALARGLAGAGHAVEVFAARRDPQLPDRSLRREPRDGWAVDWVIVNSHPADPLEALDPPGIADVFERFLQRERPEVVHFQHVLKLGLGLIERARRAGIPIVYTAHDYYPICHRFTLLRPDLSRCTTLGDPEACARCDLALSLLDRQSGLGDYQMGALPEQLEPAVRTELARLLQGDELGAGVHPDELCRARELRARLEERRRSVFAACDAILAPTRYLRERLIEGGVDARRVQVLPYGIEAADLRALVPRAGTRDQGLRAGFLGGLSKHKGVHVLLEAWERLAADRALAGKLGLEIWGGSSDAVYVAGLRARAERAGVAWRGAYAREDLPGILAGLDLVVVPSIWVENQPIVIREALAAGRPVVASRIGALPESVREGEDGWLFEPGDASDLARVLRGIALGAAPGARAGTALRDLARRLEPVKDLALQVAELERLYADLLRTAARPPAAGLPGHLEAVAARHAELEALPTRELFAMALGGLGRLAGALGIDSVAGAAVLAEALGARSRAQEFIADGRSERLWLQGLHAADASGMRSLHERVAWRESLLAQREGELEWLRQEGEGLRRERDWLRETNAGLEAERAWLRETLAGIERERDWLRETLSGIERERDWLRGEVAGRESELAGRRAELEAIEAQRKRMREDAAVREFELGWLREDLGGRYERLQAARERLLACSQHCDALAVQVASALDHPQPGVSELRRAAAGLREQLGLVRECQETLASLLPHGPAHEGAARRPAAPGGSA